MHITGTTKILFGGDVGWDHYTRKRIPLQLHTGSLSHTGTAPKTHPGCSCLDSNHRTKPNSRMFPSHYICQNHAHVTFMVLVYPAWPAIVPQLLEKWNQESLPKCWCKYTSSFEGSFAMCWGNGSLSVSFQGYYRHMLPATWLPAEHSFADWLTHFLLLHFKEVCL